MYRIRQSIELWLVWQIVTGMGWAVSGIVAAGLAELIGLKPGGLAWLAWAGLTAGAMLALSQWQKLPHDGGPFLRWTAATMMSVGVGLFAAAGLTRLPIPGWGWLLAGGVWGALIGGAQSLVTSLHRREKTSWMLRSAASWSAALGVGAALIDAQFAGIRAGGRDALLVGILGWVVISMVAGMIIIALSPTTLSKEERVRILGLP